MGTLSELAAVVNLQEAHALEELVALESEWSGLWSRCPEATPFQSPDWLIPLSTQVSDGDLCVLAMRHQGRLIGLAPFLFRTIDEGRHLVLLGTGVTDYLDVLFEPAFADECGAALLCWLADNRDKWDACDWQQLRSGSTLLAYETPPEWTSQINVQEVCPVLSLPEQIRELPRTVPLRMLEKLRYYRGRLRKLGSDQIEQARVENFDDIFERFLQLHRARWNARGNDGVSTDGRLQRFHRDSSLRMLLSGTLRFYALRSRAEIIGALYAFAHRGHTYYYLSGFDPAFAPYSPGTLLIGHAIEEAIREGSEHFDFLRGRETYKYLWGAKARLNYRRQVWHSR